RAPAVPRRGAGAVRVRRSRTRLAHTRHARDHDRRRARPAGPGRDRRGALGDAGGARRPVAGAAARHRPGLLALPRCAARRGAGCPRRGLGTLPEDSTRPAAYARRVTGLSTPLLVAVFVAGSAATWVAGISLSRSTDSLD